MKLKLAHQSGARTKPRRNFLRARGIAAVAILGSALAGCGGSGTGSNPTPVSSPFAGNYTGNYTTFQSGAQIDAGTITMTISSAGALNLTATSTKTAGQQTGMTASVSNNGSFKGSATAPGGAASPISGTITQPTSGNLSISFATQPTSGAPTSGTITATKIVPAQPLSVHSCKEPGLRRQATTTICRTLSRFRETT